jgi:hypothetical protein
MSKIATADVGSSRDVDALVAVVVAMDRAGPRSARTGEVLSDRSWALDVCVKLEERGMARLEGDVGMFIISVHSIPRGYLMFCFGFAEDLGKKFRVRMEMGIGIGMGMGMVQERKKGNRR